MSQHDMDVANASGAAVRADLNLALLALASCNSGATAPATTFAYMLWPDTSTGLLKQRNAANSAWVTVCQLSDWSLPSVQGQLATAFTTGGSSTAYTLTPAPAITANTTNQRFRVTFHTASGATPTLAVSGQTAKNLKYKDSAGTKQAITATQVPTSWTSDVEYDGTDWVVLNPVGVMTATVGGAVPTPPNNTTTFLRGDGTFAAPAGGITLGTPTATTSGGSKSYSIAAGVKRIVMSLTDVSFNGANHPYFRIGTGGTPETTGYWGFVTRIADGGGIAAAQATVGIPLGHTAVSGAATVYNGHMEFVLADSSTNRWSMNGAIYASAGNHYISGYITLSGTLDVIQLYTADSCDAGSINIQTYS